MNTTMPVLSMSMITASIITAPAETRWRDWFAFGALLLAALAGLFYLQASQGQAKQTAGALSGAAAIELLKQNGQYESLRAAMNAARFSVSQTTTSPLGRAAWHAPNPAAGYNAYVTETGVSVVVNDQSHVSLSLHALGYGSATRAVAPGQVSGEKQTINIDRDGGVREWFVNGPEGLKHGFTLREPPGTREGMPLRLVMQAGAGWRAVAGADGGQITLHGPEGQAIEYGKLVVRDNEGRNIPARLLAADQDVVIEAEDRDAAWPLTIDPVFTLQRGMVASNAGTFELFGHAVALDGDTAVIGAPYDEGRRGAAYVFVRNGAGWTEQARLLGNDTAVDDYMGWSVAISGDTVLAGTLNGPGPASADQGAVYVYTWLGYWFQQQILIASDGAAGDIFGFAVAVSGDTVATSARGNDIETNTDQGAAYVFTSPACPAITVMPATLAPAVRGVAYSGRFFATGASGSAPEYEFMVSGGALPPGMELQDEYLVGAPTATGTFRFTITARHNTSLCPGSRDYTMTVLSSCPAVTIDQTSLPGGAAGTFYNQTLTVTGGVAPHGFYVAGGSLPPGLTLQSSGALAGKLTAPGVYSFTLGVVDGSGCRGFRDFSITVTGNTTPIAGLQYYPLSAPVRLLDTRAGQTACDAPGAPITGGTARTQTAAGRTCGGAVIPANAKALTGNITTVQSGGGYLTLYPSDAAQPLVANSNYGPNEILNNVFTTGPGGGDGAFKIFVTSNTHVVVDITGYYAPPDTGGLYFHPLPKPVRLLDTRAGQPACNTPGVRLAAGSNTPLVARGACDGVTIPPTAVALVGNATTVGPQAAGYLTLYPAGVSQPLAASSNFTAGQVMNGPFMSGLSAMGELKIFTSAATDLVIDALGFYSPEPVETNSVGLLYYPLPTPVRLLDTRGGQPACFIPGAPLAAGSTRNQEAHGYCAGQPVPAAATAIVGNATVVTPAGAGYLTFWPDGVARPTVATSNYTAGQVFNRHFTTRLSAAGVFNIFTQAQTELVIDVTGYFAQ
ncbi:MAG: putative Ig domain-containing protein [Blastocatellia bacterium]